MKETQRKILIVDDDVEIIHLLRVVFEKKGFCVIDANDSKMALIQLGTNSPDLIILDIMLSNDNGLDLCKVIFEKYKIPIIMLTAVDKDQNRITAYNSGARLYNTKPISSELLVSQVKAIFREGNRKNWGNDYRYLRFHAWELDLLDRNVKQYGVSKELSTNEYNVLTLLLEHAYKTVSRNQLVKRIYNRSYSGTDDRAVDMIIARLRKKLEREDDQGKLIRTIHSQGYMIACEVEFCE